MAEENKTPGKTVVETLIHGATILTLNANREVLHDGAIAVDGGKIVAVGKSADIVPAYAPRHSVDASACIVTPGLVDAHIHITGDPLTRGVRRGPPGAGFTDNLMNFVIPLYQAHSAADERLSAQFAALRMLKHGVTSFVEAGTVLHLDELVAGLDEVGIRARVGGWVEGRSFDPAKSETGAIDAAIAILEDQLRRFPPDAEGRVAVWPLLIGHTVNPDEVWQAAKRIADDHGLGFSAHMSPYGSDPEWFLANTGKRPIEHLAELGVLGSNVSLTHVCDVSEREVDILSETGTSVAFCPYSAIIGAFGVASRGLYPEMADKGITLTIGTDGNPVDLLSSANLMAGLLRDARRDETLFPATQMLEMLTRNGARAMGLEHRLGAVEVGHYADLALYENRRTHWSSSFDVADQVINAGGGAQARSVWVQGRRVIENYRSTMIDEDAVCARLQAAGESIVARSGVPVHQPWPVR